MILFKHYLLKLFICFVIVIINPLLSFPQFNTVKPLVPLTQNNSAAPTTEDIKDIKALEKIERISYLPIVVIFSLLLIAACLYLYFRFKRKKPKPIQPELPHQIALSKLKALRNASYLDQGDYRAFHYALSEIFREYLQARYNFHATDLTTEEILALLSNSLTLNNKQQATVTAILTLTDSVKFAQINPGNDKSLDVLADCETFILDAMVVHEN
jgi:hypothetical protein